MLPRAATRMIATPMAAGKTLEVAPESNLQRMKIQSRTGTLHLHRIVMRFNREDYARLRQMIDVINGEELASQI